MPYNHPVSYTYNNRKSVDLYDIENPTICPQCHHAIDPTLIAISIDSQSSGSIVFFCRKCFKTFIAEFHHRNYSSSGSPYFERYMDFAPKIFKNTDFSKIITKLSPRFIEVYNQALNAESIGLTEICGMGFRKSLEILIKDYVISKKPQEIDAINDSKYMLSQCINDHIEEPRIKNPSKAASWIGNDESHYSRKHDSKDVNDLKEYILTVVFFIQYDLLADESAAFVGS